ncbi:MAG: 2OG-Fe(II) oxygenase [Pseudomonadota bacterium]|nr:2OG-Fe(II) oxygenase [Pseudomonadota bacterium]
MSVLNLAAFDRAPLNSEPFDFLVVKDAIESDMVEVLNRDYPKIDKPTNYDPGDLDYGPSFKQLLKELDSSEFERHVASKFAVDLSGAKKTITVRKYSEPSDGHIHTDHWSKIITLLVYFNPQWDQDGGRLRILRSCGNIEDYSAEVTPLGGTVLAFRRSDKSWHGYKSFDGERRMIQMSWVKHSRFAWYAQQAARWWTHALKRVARVFSSVSG